MVEEPPPSVGNVLVLECAALTVAWLSNGSQRLSNGPPKDVTARTATCGYVLPISQPFSVKSRVVSLREDVERTARRIPHDG